MAGKKITIANYEEKKEIKNSQYDVKRGTSPKSPARAKRKGRGGAFFRSSKKKGTFPSDTKDIFTCLPSCEGEKESRQLIGLPCCRGEGREGGLAPSVGRKKNCLILLRSG